MRIIRQNNMMITDFQVFGERSLGTNYLSEMLKLNLYIEATRDYGWKHGFPTAIVYRHRSLLFVSSRNVLDWVLSMYAKPWHTTKHMQELSFSDFIRHEWQTVVDQRRGISMRRITDGRLMQPMQFDVHPLSGLYFKNLIEMRNFKNTGFLSFKNRFCNVVYLKHEDFKSDPFRYLEEISDIFRIKMKADVQNISRRLGARIPLKTKHIRNIPKSISNEDKVFIFKHLDLKIEEEIGYNYNTQQ